MNPKAIITSCNIQVVLGSDLILLKQLGPFVGSDNTMSELEILENNRLIKQLQEKLLMSQYESAQLKKLTERQQELLNKRKEYEDSQRVVELEKLQRSKYLNERRHERESLVSDYEASIAERKRKEQEQRQKKIEEGRRIAQMIREQEITQRQMERQKLQQFKREAERQVQEKHNKIAIEQERKKELERQQMLLLQERVRKEKQMEEEQRKYYKNFNQSENKRLYLNLQMPDSLEEELQKRMKVSQTPRYQKPQDYDDAHNYREYLRKLERSDYKEGLDLQVREKQIRQRARRMSQQEIQTVDRSVYNPITNPIPVHRKNPNVIRQLLSS